MLGFGLGLLVGIPVGVILGMAGLGYALHRFVHQYGKTPDPQARVEVTSFGNADDVFSSESMH